jgi:hypothetical protein
MLGVEVEGLFLGPHSHAAGLRSGGHAGPLTSWTELGSHEPMGSGRSYTYRISYEWEWEWGFRGWGFFGGGGRMRNGERGWREWDWDWDWDSVTGFGWSEAWWIEKYDLRCWGLYDYLLDRRKEKSNWTRWINGDLVFPFRVGRLQSLANSNQCLGLNGQDRHKRQ